MRNTSNRLGVSVIIAALLLIAIAVASAMLFYLYAAGLVGSLQASGGMEMRDQLELENYNWQTLGVLVLNVRNVGPSTLNMAQADYFVNGAASTFATTCGVSFQPETACIISLTVPNQITVGKAYPVKIALADGAVFEYSCTAGTSG